MKLVYITLSQIEALHPCEEALRDVRQFFGERKRVRVTVKAAVAVAQRFNFYWLAVHTLRGGARAVYTEALEGAWADYSKSIAAAEAAYNKATPAARAVYDRSKADARAVFKNAVARAHARAYINQKRERQS